MDSGNPDSSNLVIGLKHPPAALLVAESMAGPGVVSRWRILNGAPRLASVSLARKLAASVRVGFLYVGARRRRPLHCQPAVVDREHPFHRDVRQRQSGIVIDYDDLHLRQLAEREH